MLKGKMTVELTDVNTGEVQTVYEDNMVTDAVANIFKPMGLSKHASKLLNGMNPYHQTLLGGMLLFDSAIEERTNNLYAPSTANLVGCAVYGEQNNTKGTLRGGFNQTESEYDAIGRTVKYVYDFSTSQANGTIASICLTHKAAGYSAYGGKDSTIGDQSGLGIPVCDGTLQYVASNLTGGQTSDGSYGYTAGKTEMILFFNLQEDAVYYLRIDSQKKLTITKRRAYMKSVSLFENPYLAKALIETLNVEELKKELPSTGICYNFDPDSKCLYIVSSKEYLVEPDDEFLVTCVKFPDLEVKQYTMTNTTQENITVASPRLCFVHKGCILFRAYSNQNHLYKMELGNSANVELMKLVGFTNLLGYFTVGINGRVYIENRGYEYGLYVVNLTTNEVMRAEQARITSNRDYVAWFTPVWDDPMMYYVAQGSYAGFIIFGSYLATINNLTEPVTKTADKTMKVTYIIQEQ